MQIETQTKCYKNVISGGSCSCSFDQKFWAKRLCPQMTGLRLFDRSTHFTASFWPQLSLGSQPLHQLVLVSPPPTSTLDWCSPFGKSLTLEPPASASEARSLADAEHSYPSHQPGARLQVQHQWLQWLQVQHRCTRTILPSQLPAPPPVSFVSPCWLSEAQRLPHRLQRLPMCLRSNWEFAYSVESTRVKSEAEPMSFLSF